MTGSPKATILLVEDEPDLRETMGEMLAAAGYRVLVAADGAEGAAVFDREFPDLVITDLVMPKADGFDLIDHCRRARPEVCLIAVSGAGTPPGCFLIPARALGAAITLDKPLRCAELLRTVEDCLSEVSFAATPRPVQLRAV